MDNLLLLHGALGSPAQMTPLVAHLEARFRCHTPCFTGHGGRSIPEGGFSFSAFADDIVSYMDENGLESSHVFGYSMGGYAALVAARKYPERFGRIVTLGTKFDWNPATASREVGLLNPAMMEQKIPAFAARLADIHQPVSWKDVVNATARFMTALGYKPDLDTAAMGTITTPSLLMVGDQDVTAGVEATRTAAVCMPGASFRVLNATPHPIEKVDMSMIATAIIGFAG